MGVQVILTASNSMTCDDAAEPFLAAVLQSAPAPGWRLVDGGSALENFSHRVRGVEPEWVLVVDAAEVGLEPGYVRLVDDRLIVEQFIICLIAAATN